MYISIFEVNGFSAALETFANNFPLVNELESLMKSAAALTEENDLARASIISHTHTHAHTFSCAGMHEHTRAELHYTGCHRRE